MPRPKAVPPKPERVNTGIRFSAPLYARIRAEAQRRRVSVNKLVEWMAEDWLSDHENR